MMTGIVYRLKLVGIVLYMYFCDCDLVSYKGTFPFQKYSYFNGAKNNRYKIYLVCTPSPQVER